MTFTPLRTLGQFYQSSVGKKTVVALTAIALLLFLPVHVIGNLLIFVGAEALNEYAHFLQHGLLHGAGVWIFRFGLLAVFAIHVLATIQLTLDNRAARAAPYEVKTPQNSTISSRTMVITGLIVLSFVIFHLLHFTVRSFYGFGDLKVMIDGKEAADVYSMVVAGFAPKFWYVTLFYVIGVTLLCTHLAHGVSSVFQTLGLRSRKTASLIDLIGYAYALFIFLGFLSVPIAVAVGFVK